MHTTVRTFWLSVIVILLFQAGVSSAEKDAMQFQGVFSGIDFKNGLLRISIENREFQEVMAEVAQKTGIPIVMNVMIDKRLTLHFDYLPLEQALKRITRGSNCVFIYRSEGDEQHAELLKVLIFPKSAEGTTSVLAGSDKKVFSKPAIQTPPTGDMSELEKKMLEEILKNLPQESEDLKIEFYEALKSLKDTTSQ